MIKLGFRRNSIYIVLFFIFYYIRRVDKILLNRILNFNNSLIFSFLMHSGEFFGGLLSYIYQITSVKNNYKEIIPVKLYGIKIISNTKSMNRADGCFKIFILIFFAAFFDFTEYILINFFIPNIATMSPTVDIRLNSITTISSSLIFIFALRLKIGKHQFYSLIIIGICLGLVVIVETIYKNNEIESFGSLLLAYILIMFALSLITFTDTIEKYLYEFNFLNPLLILFLESIFGIIFIILAFIFVKDNPFLKINILYKDLGIKKFILLIIFFVLYLVFSAFVNIYKVLSNVYYSPMAKSVSSYVLNPALIIYSFFSENDFISDGKRDVLYFVINIIISIIIVFFGCIYNEFFILKCWGLDYETHYVISERAESQIIDMTELSVMPEEEEDENDDFDENNKING